MKTQILKAIFTFQLLLFIFSIIGGAFAQES